ncbi:Uncharacterised protein [Mycobacterium tuberculosis]|nr:Uncharacterised protein [Mycobacterium tuberculosis]
MGPRILNQRFVDEKRHHQKNAAAEQRHNGSGIEPVQPVALIEAGIDHGNAGSEQQHAAPVRGFEQLPVDRVARGTEVNQ